MVSHNLVAMARLPKVIWEKAVHDALIVTVANDDIPTQSSERKIRMTISLHFSNFLVNYFDEQ